MTAILLAIAAWSAQFAAVAAAAALALRAADVRSPRVRLAAWQATFAAALAAPAAGAVWLAPGRSILADGMMATAAAGLPGTEAGATFEAWCAFAVACLLAGAAVRVAWVLAGWRRLRRWGALPRATSEVFDETAAAVGVDARLVCADGIGSPFTFGWRTPVVVANPRLLDDPRTARAAFLHELEHVARRDWVFAVAEEVVRAVLWFHPAAWWATAEIRIAREEIVDRAAAARLGSRRAYLEALLAIGPETDPGRTLVSALIHRHQLARRVRSLAAEVPMSTRQLVLATLVVTVGVTGVAYAAAGTFPVWSPMASAVGTAAADDVEKPVPIKKVEAVYPPEAKEKKVEGNVELLVRIGADGLVKDATVQKSISMLDEAALTAIRQWEFKAGRVKGKPVEVMSSITFAFRLK